MKYKTWNDCKGLETLARATFESIEAAKAHTTAAGGPNRIIADDGQEWMRAAHADSAPYWVGPYPAGYLATQSNVKPYTAVGDEAERKRIQAELNFHPDASPFWDTPRGRETLESAHAMKLKATNTNKERCAIYADAKRNAAYPHASGRRFDK